MTALVSSSDENGKGCNVIDKSSSTDSNTLTLDVLDNQHLDLMANLEAVCHCPDHSNSPQIYQCGTCWDRLKMCIYCFSEDHSGHFLQMADKYCVPNKSVPIAEKEEPNSSKILWQNENLYDDCNPSTNLVEVDDIHSDCESLDIEPFSQSTEQESIMLTTNESEQSDESNCLFLSNASMQKEESSLPREDLQTLQNVLNQAWLSEVSTTEKKRIEEKRDETCSNLHPSWLRGTKKLMTQKATIKTFNKPVKKEKFHTVLPLGRPPRQTQVPVKISTMLKLMPVQTIVKVDQATNNAVSVVAVGRKRASPGFV